MENKPFKIFSIGEPELTDEICKHSKYGSTQGSVRTDVFADGEMSPQYMESIRDRTVFIVCSTNTPEKTLQLELALDAGRRASADKMVVLMPYHGYSRQDRKEGIRGPIGAKVMANKLVAAGAQHIITSDLHADQIQGFYDIPVDHILGRTIFRPYMESLPPADNYAIFSPDTGGAKRAEKMYKKMYELHPGTTFGLCHKSRDKPNSVEKMILIGDVKGRKVKLVDDMIDTAGTIVKAAEMMMEAGAESVEAWITHLLLSDPANERIDKCTALSKVIGSNSIRHKTMSAKIEVISSAYIFSRVIDAIVTRQSVDKINTEG